MTFYIFTIFPDSFEDYFNISILKRAQKKKLIKIKIYDIRKFAKDKHLSVDDRPYGGGEGMVFMPAPLFEAVEFCRGAESDKHSQVILMSPQGKTWSQNLAAEFATITHLILICGRYEGVDQRVVDCLVDREISVGDFILTGGEIPAMVVLDSVVRLIPGALGCWDSTINESFSTGLLDYPQYTRPAEYRGHAVPEVLLSGDHAKIRKWREEQALDKTKRARPELMTTKLAQH